jgi:hypothetical protein
MTRTTTCLLLCALAWPAAGLAVPPTPPARVDNAADPRDGVETQLLEPLWRLGGEDDEEVFFGVIDAVARDHDGNVLLADMQLMQINVVSPDGELAAVLGRQGEGPGEVTRLGGVLPLPDGTVGMVQLMPGRVIKVDPAGLPAGEIVPRWTEEGGRLMLAEIRLAGDRLIAAGRRMTRRDETFLLDLWIAELDDDGAVGRIFYREQRERDLRSGTVSELDGDWAGENRWTATADGRVVVAPRRDEYLLEFHGPDGLERTVTRAFTTRERTEAEKEAVRSRFNRFRGRGRGGRMANLEVEVADTAPAVRGIHAMPGGEIWVLTSRGDRDQAAGVMLTYDVLDPEGNFIRQIAVACEGVASRDALFPLGSGDFVLVKGHADALAAMRGSTPDDADAELDDAAPLEIVGLRAAANP